MRTPQAAIMNSSRKQKGYLALILHAHLPFVRHPECDHFMEEAWLFEAITETYIPLLTVFNNLAADSVPFKITMSMTAPLCSMLTDPLLQQRYTAHIEKLIELAEKECTRTKKDARFAQTARMYLKKFRTCRTIFADTYKTNLVSAFRSLSESGQIELITCGATHGYLPTMQHNPKAVQAQVSLGIEAHADFFGKKPAGMWLPECGYYPGLEEILERNGIRYFFVDTHGILFAAPPPKYGVFAPVYCGKTSVAAFGRDAASSKSVWSSKIGYPGDPVYRDFYRDIGYDLDINYVRPYIDPVGIPMSTGIKYYRITGDTRYKEPYNKQEALTRAAQHAETFIHERNQQIKYLSSLMDRTPIIVAPYDAELFGHWWYEGPEWLNCLIRKIASQQDIIELTSCSRYLETYPDNQVTSPSYSSWGEHGYSAVWIDKSNDWIYRHIHAMQQRMCDAARSKPNARDLVLRACNQMARELLLAESSDWAFMMKMGAMKQYAVRRIKEHIANFSRLYRDLQNESLDIHFISLLESHNNIFPHIDYHAYL